MYKSLVDPPDQAPAFVSTDIISRCVDERAHVTQNVTDSDDRGASLAPKLKLPLRA